MTPFPRIFPRSPIYKVSVNSQAVDVLRAKGADYAIFPFSGPSDIKVEVLQVPPLPEAVVLRPKRLGYSAEQSAHEVNFHLPAAENLFVDMPGINPRSHPELKPLYLFPYDPAARAEPPAAEGKLHRFTGGQVHEVGELWLGSGDVLWIEPGAVVRGLIRSEGVENLHIGGQGVLDGSYIPKGGPLKHERTILLNNSANITIEDITIVDPSAWTLVTVGCDEVTIDGIRTITIGGGSDGIDLVATNHAVVRNCFLRTGDDCVVIKAFTHTADGKRSLDRVRDVDDILVERCTLLQDGGGNALEIGHELLCDSIANITFRDCDIVHVHGFGAALSINNGAWGTVRDVRFEDLRVEHHYDALISFRIMHSRYSHSAERGHLKNILVRNLACDIAPVNLGYSRSLIGGWDDAHLAEDIVLENVTFNGQKVTNATELDLFTRAVKNLQFR